jgi:hypothetical protein
MASRIGIATNFSIKNEKIMPVGLVDANQGDAKRRRMAVY